MLTYLHVVTIHHKSLFFSDVIALTRSIFRLFFWRNIISFMDMACRTHSATIRWEMKVIVKYLAETLIKKK